MRKRLCEIADETYHYCTEIDQEIGHSEYAVRVEEVKLVYKVCMNHSCCLRSAALSALPDRVAQLVWENGDYEWMDEKQLLNRGVKEFTLNDALHTAHRLSTVCLRIDWCAPHNLRIAQMVNGTATAHAAN